MARSTRAADRGTSPPKASGKGRTARSESRELGVNDGPKPSRQTRSTRQTTVDTADGKASKPNARQKTTRAAELSTVREGEVAAEDVAEEEVEEEIQNEPEPSKSTMDQAASRITPPNTESQAQARPDLNIDLMLSELPWLDKFSSEVMKQISSPVTADVIANIKESMGKKTSKLYKGLNLARRDMDVTKANFGDGLYIENDLISQTLFGVRAPDVESGRPDTILWKTNVAVLSSLFVHKLEEGSSSKDFMMHLDEVFPSPFIPAPTVSLSSMEDSESELWRDTLDLALNIRIQLVIVLLQEFRGQEIFDPDSIIARVFYQSGEDMSTEEILHVGKLRSVANLNQTETIAQSERIASIINNIRATEVDDTQAQQTKEYVNFEELRNKYPWDTFCIKMLDWLQQRAKGYENIIEGYGGVYKIIDMVKKEIPDPSQQMNFHYAPPMAQMTSEASSQSSARAEAEKKKHHRAIKAMAQVIYNSPGRPSPRLPKPKTPANHTPSSLAGPSNDNTIIADRPSTPPDIRKLSARWKSVEEEKNKENSIPVAQPAQKKRFIDAQAGAKKVNFDDDDDEVEAVPRRKRTRGDAGLDGEDETMFVPEGESRQGEQEEPSEDEGFQQDQRPHKPVRRASPKKQRLESGPSNGQAGPSSANQQDRNGDDGNDDEGIAPVSSQAYQNVNSMALLAAARSRVHTSQTRIPWTPAECECLVDLIAEFGNSFSAISKSDEAKATIQERHRDQVAIKDKARNIKVDYLLSGLPLPTNFDVIKLGQKERDRIKKAGLNPYRKEGEDVGHETLDENGDPYE